MSGRPKVFKGVGVWVAVCDEHAAGPWFQIASPEGWRDPWQAALQAATLHAVQFHELTEGEEVR